MVVRLQRRAIDGTAGRSSKDLWVEDELGTPLPCRPGQDLSNPEALHAAGAGRRLDSQPRRLREGAKHEVLLDAPLIEEFPAADQVGGSAWQDAAYRAHLVAGYSAVHQLLVVTLLEVHLVHFDAGEAFGEARRRQANWV